MKLNLTLILTLTIFLTLTLLTLLTRKTYSVGHTDTKFCYQYGVLIDSTDGATLLSAVLAQTN